MSEFLPPFSILALFFVMSLFAILFFKLDVKSGLFKLNSKKKKRETGKIHVKRAYYKNLEYNQG